ncbi:MAG: ABC transporter permease, partial [Bacteroidota bacterium]|nr:ABC transporter permease [Bacteroidota bacterium]
MAYILGKRLLMIFHFAKVILRFFSRQFFYTSLNIIGLSTGMASCIVIFLFITHELSYDKFHRDGDRIFRVIRQSQMNGMPYNIGVTSGPFATALKQDYAQRIESVTRALAFDAMVTYKDRSFAEEQLLLADKNFFDFFSFPLRAGDPSSVFENGNSLVISAAVATRYFGSEDPIGKMIRLDDQYDLMVTGVMDESPGNSHLQFDAVGSLNIAEGEDWMEDWWSNSFYTYVKLRSAQDAPFLNASFPAFMEKYFGKDFERVGNKIGLTLEPLRDIYFNFDTRYEEDVAHGDRRYVYVFGTIGCLLLLLAGINYINLATAQSSTRAREVGIRKTLGSAQASVAIRFLSESFILCLFSTVLATGVAQVSIPVFNAQFGTSIPQVFDDPRIFVFLLILVIVLTLAAGAYPSFLLS